MIQGEGWYMIRELLREGLSGALTAELRAPDTEIVSVIGLSGPPATPSTASGMAQRRLRVATSDLALVHGGGRLRREYC